MNKEKKILFSIIMPTYNRATMIAKAIESVINQTYTNWELIIIDDGSSDNTAEIINSYNDSRVKYFFRENRGKSVARNTGIDNSVGEFIAFLDDDDYYLPEFLSKFYDKIIEEKNKTGIYMCRVAEEDKGQTIAKEINTKYLENPPLLIWKYGANYLPFVTSREVFKTEKYDPQFPLGQDYHLLIRVVMKLPLFYIPDVLCVIRNHPDRSVVKEYKEDFKPDETNRLDYLIDLLDNYFDKLKQFIPVNHIFDKYNKIAYFYASTALRKNKIKYALKLMKSIKWGGTKYKVIYYKLSIFLRSAYYIIYLHFKRE